MLGTLLLLRCFVHEMLKSTKGRVYDWGQEMLAIIRCRIFCLPGCYPKI